MSTDDDKASREKRGREIRKRLQDARDQLDMSQQDVARIVGVSRQAVSQWENYDSHPTVEHLADWARAVGRRIRIQVVDPADGREPLFVRPESGPTIHQFESLSDADRAMVAQWIRRLAGETE